MPSYNGLQSFNFLPPQNMRCDCWRQKQEKLDKKNLVLWIFCRHCLFRLLFVIQSLTNAALEQSHRVQRLKRYGNALAKGKSERKKQKKTLPHRIHENSNMYGVYAWCMHVLSLYIVYVTYIIVIKCNDSAGAHTLQRQQKKKNEK